MPIAAAIGGAVVTGLFAKSSAKDQEDFQEEMSSTAHQREVKDLRAAGLNPILSAGGSGASSPGGAAYSMPDLAGSMASGQAVSRSQQETKNLKATEPNIRKTHDLIQAQANQAQTSSALASAQYNKTLEETKGQQIRNKANLAQLAGIETEGRIDKSKYGQAVRYLGRLNPFASSVKSLKPKGK